MVRKLFCIMLFLLAMPLISALETSITVKTFPLHNVTIYIMNPSTSDLLRTIEETSNEAGIVSTTFSADLTNIDFSIIVRKDGKIVTTSCPTGVCKFENYNIVGPISIDLLSLEPVSQPNQSSTNVTTNITTNTSTINASTSVQENITEENITENQTITGAVTSQAQGKNLLSKIPKIVYFIVGGGILAIVVVFLLIKIVPFSSVGSLMKPRAPASYKVRKYPDVTGVDEKKLLDAEKKIKEAQEEIDVIRNKKRQVEEAEKKFEEAKKDLEKLKGGKI